MSTKNQATYRAPGRVNLIGEHTDYNDGFVLPAALDLSTWVTVAPRQDRKITVHTDHLDQSFTFDLDDPAPASRHEWTDYVQGVAVMLERAGHRLCGADLSLRSDVPLGSGLSSSAALEVSVGYTLLDTAGIAVDRTELAKICQRAENEFVGMRCGIMDQFIACHGEADHALMIDCRSLNSRLVPLGHEERIVIVNSMVKHQLAGSEYNLRRQECERGVALLAPVLGPITALRDVSLEQLTRHAALLPELTLRRCRHVVSENARVLKAADALASGDAVLFGELMKQSHVSMRDDFEISCQELDLLVEIALGIDGVLGSRMTGGGFGGCTVSLVEANAVDHFTATIAKAYASATGKVPMIFTCSPGAGVGKVA